MSKKKLMWVVYEDGGIIAHVHYAEHAAAVVGNTVDGIVKHNRIVVWREGEEAFGACASFDDAAGVMFERAGLTER